MTLATAPIATPDKAAEAELAALAKAFGHPARVAILRLLLGREACFCGEIVEHVPRAQATVSQHLKVLRDVGLVEGEIDGPRTCYWANRERIAQLHELIGVMLAEAVVVTGDQRECL
jgi:ArsR family transcriptional regulator, arsenate/arsenite/antimonite-responsive transcriptional repressor